ncbi:MAG: tripartite tricarboxylate transporter substrate binding protein [Burkholderiales bacterium]|nr:tripartite tricarboxylate transporter substrate binding protein [Burkholderiales bacterium]
MSMQRRQGMLGLVALMVGGAARGDAFPSRPITLIVPFAPGGIADLVARAVAQAMAASLKQALVVDNRPSAGSIVAAQAVLSAPADGHTLLLMSNAQAISAGLMRKLPFDAQRDFAPITRLAAFDLGLFVDSASRFTDLAAFMAEAKAKPGKLTIGTIAVGSTQHLSAELFKSQSGIDALVVPYKGSPAVLTALRSGEIDLAVEILGPWVPQVQAKVIRALALGSTHRHAELPEVPTAQQAGLTGFDVSSWNGLAAPARTPAAVIARLNEAANEALHQPAVQRQLQALGVRAEGGTPQQLRDLLAQETERWAVVIRRAKIEPQ